VDPDDGRPPMSDGDWPGMMSSPFAWVGSLNEPEVVYRRNEERLRMWAGSVVAGLRRSVWKLWSLVQLLASTAYVGLYIYSTYYPIPKGSAMSVVELGLCSLFAVDFGVRLSMSNNPGRKLLRLGSILELFTFTPQLVEWALLVLFPDQVFAWPKTFNISWVKMFRVVTVTRRVLLAGQMQGMHLSSSEEFLSSGEGAGRRGRGTGARPPRRLRRPRPRLRRPSPAPPLPQCRPPGSSR